MHLLCQPHADRLCACARCCAMSGTHLLLCYTRAVRCPVIAYYIIHAGHAIFGTDIGLYRAKLGERAVLGT
eukprot:3627360-Rhodomonas_salina.3